MATDLTTRQALASVVVVMNNDVHLGRYVFKSDSQLIGAFRSHPGPIGQVCCDSAVAAKKRAARAGKQALYACARLPL